MIYKPDAHSNQHPNHDQSESEFDPTTSLLPHHPEIPTSELRKLLNLKQKLDK